MNARNVPEAPGPSKAALRRRELNAKDGSAGPRLQQIQRAAMRFRDPARDR
jgi:hypothetical protein